MPVWECIQRGEQEDRDRKHYNGVRKEMIPELNASLRDFRAEFRDDYEACRKRYLLAQRTELLERVKVEYDNLEDVKDWVQLSIRERINKMRRKIKKINGELDYVFNKNNPGGGLTQEDIARARVSDIASLDLVQHLRKSGYGRYTAPCIFHDEKTGSMTIYPEGRGFYCFGCHKSGTAIDIVMQTLNLNFVDAVKYLLG